MRWLDNITDSMGMNRSKFWETVEERRAWWAAVHGVRYNLATEQQQHRVKEKRMESTSITPLKKKTIWILYTVPAGKPNLMKLISKPYFKIKLRNPNSNL